MRYSLFYLILAVLNFSICFSEIPQSISWQGILQDVNGNNLNGQFNITCKLYDVASGGNALWTESHTNLTIENGLTNLSLGTISSLNLLFNVQ